MSLDPNSDGTVFAQRNETLGQSVHEVSRPRPCDPMRVSERASETNSVSQLLFIRVFFLLLALDQLQEGSRMNGYVF